MAAAVSNLICRTLPVLFAAALWSGGAAIAQVPPVELPADGAAKKEAPKRAPVETKEPPEIPKPSTLAAGSYLILEGGKVVGSERYKMVRSNHSGKIFASSQQIHFSKAITPDRYFELDGRQRRKLRARRRANYLEMDDQGSLQKYKTWTAGDGRSYVLLLRRKSGFVRRNESLSGRGSEQVAAPEGTMPYLPDHLALVRIAAQRAERAGGSLSIIDPLSGSVATLNLAAGGGGTTVLAGAGGGGVLTVDGGGQISEFRVGDRRFVPRAVIKEQTLGGGKAAPEATGKAAPPKPAPEGAERPKVKQIGATAPAGGGTNSP